MLIGIISDTHDKLKRTTRAVERLKAEGVEALVHCGDLTGPEVVIICAELPLYFVFGNNDADSVTLLRDAARETGANCLEWGDRIEMAGKHIAVVHGHMTTDVRRVTKLGPDYVLFGHSHIPTDSRDGGTRWINPGALHRAEAWTVATLDLEKDELRFLTIE